MHTYIYDSFVNQQKYNKIISNVEIRITDLGLNGKIVRLGLMSSLTNIIKNELNKNAKTIIVVGDNTILHQAINSIAKIKQEIKTITPIAFIPIGKNNSIADLLGLTSAENACNILSARRKETLDLGLINEHYFLTEAEISTENTIIKIDKNYSIKITKPGKIRIINIADKQKLPQRINPQANDNILELYIKITKSCMLPKHLQIPAIANYLRTPQHSPGLSLRSSPSHPTPWPGRFG